MAMNAFNSAQRDFSGANEQPPIAALLTPGSHQGQVDPEMVGMIRLRRRDARRHQAQLAQIRRHPDPAEGASGLAQQRVWALRHARQRRLQRSDLAMLRRSL